jgi:hypothetical protein
MAEYFTWPMWTPQITIKDVTAVPNITYQLINHDTRLNLRAQNKILDELLNLPSDYNRPWKDAIVNRFLCHNYNSPPPISHHEENLRLISDLLGQLMGFTFTIACKNNPKWRENLIAEEARHERFERLIRGEYAKMRVWVREKRMLEEEVGLRLKWNTWMTIGYVTQWIERYAGSYNVQDKPFWWTTALNDRDRDHDQRITQNDDEWCVAATVQRFRWTIDIANAEDTEGSVEELRDRRFRRQWKLNKFADRVATAVAKKRQDYKEEVDRRFHVSLRTRDDPDLPPDLRSEQPHPQEVAEVYVERENLLFADNGVYDRNAGLDEWMADQREQLSDWGSDYYDDDLERYEREYLDGDDDEVQSTGSSWYRRMHPPDQNSDVYDSNEEVPSDAEEEANELDHSHLDGETSTHLFDPSLDHHPRRPSQSSPSYLLEQEEVVGETLAERYMREHPVLEGEDVHDDSTLSSSREEQQGHLEPRSIRYISRAPPPAGYIYLHLKRNNNHANALPRQIP